jgi:hypothetical protein
MCTFTFRPCGQTLDSSLCRTERNAVVMGNIEDAVGRKGTNEMFGGGAAHVKPLVETGQQCVATSDTDIRIEVLVA